MGRIYDDMKAQLDSAPRELDTLREERRLTTVKSDFAETVEDVNMRYEDGGQSVYEELEAVADERDALRALLDECGALLFSDVPTDEDGIYARDWTTEDLRKRMNAERKGRT